jgi:hypothetical protein
MLNLANTLCGQLFNGLLLISSSPDTLLLRFLIISVMSLTAVDKVDSERRASRRLPTTATRVRGQVRSCGICGTKCGTGAYFLRVLRFYFQIFISLTAPHSSSIIRGCYNRSISGRRTKWSQSHPTPRN